MPGAFITVLNSKIGSGGDGLPRISSLSAAAGVPGTEITITGVNFYYITAVRFNGVNAAAFTVNSATSIVATVPEDSGDGPLDVISIFGHARWDSFSGCPSGGGGVTLASIAVTPNPLAANINTDTQLTATGTYSDASTLNITSAVDWSSTDEDVATVTNGSGGGVATAEGNGIATVTATLGDVSGTTDATVTTPGVFSRSTATQGYADGGNTPLRVTTIPIPVTTDIAGTEVYLTFSNQSAAYPNTAHGPAITGANFALYKAEIGPNGPQPVTSGPVDLLGGIGIGVNVPDSGGVLSIGPFALSGGIGSTGYLVALLGNPANTHMNTAAGITTGEYVDGTNTVDPVPGGRSGFNNATGTCRLTGWRTSRPRLVCAGNSLMNNYSSPGTYAPRREEGAYVKIGPDNDWAVDTIGISGMRLDQATSLAKFFDGVLPAPLLTDLSINSLPHWADLAAAQAEYAAFIAAAQLLGFTDFFLSTLTPSDAYPDATYGTLRNAVNTWLRTLPLGIIDIVDNDLVLRDPADHTQLLEAYRQADKTHFSVLGNATLATEITSVVGPHL